jgi:hypothetical protein
MFMRFSGKAGRLGAEKGAGCSLCRGREPSLPRTECVPYAREAVDTLCGPLYSQSQSLMSVAKKIQVGQLWKKDGTKDIYLVTRLYSEALNTMVILRRSGAEDEAQIRVRVERAAGGQKIPGFSPAQEDEKF